MYLAIKFYCFWKKDATANFLSDFSTCGDLSGAPRHSTLPRIDYFKNKSSCGTQEEAAKLQQIHYFIPAPLLVRLLRDLNSTHFFASVTQGVVVKKYFGA